MEPEEPTQPVAPSPAPVPTTTPTSPERKGGKTKKVSKYGTRRKVFGGSAEMTTGGLRKEHLMKNQRGRIVSVKKHTTMKNSKRFS